MKEYDLVGFEFQQTRIFSKSVTFIDNFEMVSNKNPGKILLIRIHSTEARVRQSESVQGKHSSPKIMCRTNNGWAGHARL